MQSPAASGPLGGGTDQSGVRSGDVLLDGVMFAMADRRAMLKDPVERRVDELVEVLGGAFDCQGVPHVLGVSLAAPTGAAGAGNR